MKCLFHTPRFRVAGDTGLLVEYGDCIAPEVNRKVRAMTFVLDGERVPGIIEVVPTYRSVLILYDPGILEVSELCVLVEALERRLDESVIPLPKTVTVPVCYGGEFGPDIEFVAQHNGIGVPDVIRAHSGAIYQIYMIGFTPGFPYLGGLPEILHTPRLETPRDRVPRGSVGIANNQTGIYPVESPGGWRLIGRTPLRLFDPARANPFLYESGDLIRFEPITEEEYLRIAGCAVTVPLRDHTV